MKAILVVDVNMTKDNKHICEDDKQRCPLWNTDIKFCMYSFNNNTKKCPLKPMQKKVVNMSKEKDNQYYYDLGFNDCLNEILGGEDE